MNSEVEYENVRRVARGMLEVFRAMDDESDHSPSTGSIIMHTNPSDILKTWNLRSEIDPSGVCLTPLVFFKASETEHGTQYDITQFVMKIFNYQHQVIIVST